MAKSITVALELDTSNFNRGIKQVDQGLDSVGRSAEKSKTSIAGVAAGLTALVGASAGLVSAVNAARSVEDLGITLKTLYGDAELAAQALDIVTESAAKLPVSLADIQAGVPSLALVEEQMGGLGNAIEFTSGIANAFGMSFQDAASNVQRALSAGIASADTFRDRGVKAFLGFQEGVEYTAEQTQELFTASFEKVTQANADAVNTMTGQLSMFSDALFQIQVAVGEAFGEAFMEALSGVTEAFAQNKEQIIEVARTIGEVLGGALKIVIENFDILVAAMAGAFAAAAVGQIIAVVNAIVTFTNAVKAAATAATILQGVTGIGLIKVGAGIAGASAALLAMNELYDDQVIAIQNVEAATTSLQETQANPAQLEQLEEIVVTAQRVSEVIVMTEEQKQEAMERTNELMAESDKMLEEIHKRALERGEEIVENVAAKNEALEREIEIAQAVIGLTEEEAELKEQLMDLEYKRQDALKAIADMLVTDEERNRLTEELNALTDEQINLVKQRHETAMAAMQAEDAKAKENADTQISLYEAINSTMEDLNKTAMDGMKAAFVDFVETGKGSFSDLIDDMIKQLKRLLAQKIFEAVLGFLSGGISNIFSGFFDSGGMIPQGKFGIVGEKGPEIVTGPARVIGRLETQQIMEGANSGGSTQVVYNINATDAQSFRDMIARDPGFIYNVTRAGARLQPI
jgi:lambda family phage tail tape measure protein